MKLSMQAKVGIIAILAVLTLATMVVWKGDMTLISHGYELVGAFNNAGGIMPGAEVRYRGFKVGKVTKMDPNPIDVKVFMIIESSIKVPTGSTLRIAFDGLIGQKYVEIIPGISTASVRNGETLTGFSTLGIVDFIDIGTQNLEQTKQILESIKKVTNDPVIQKSAKQTLLNIEKATYEIDRIATELSKTLRKGGFDDTLKALNTSAATINSMSKKLDGIISAIDEVVGDPGFKSDIKDTAKNAKEAFDEFKKASQDASRVLKKYSK